MGNRRNTLSIVIAFVVGGAVFPLWGKVYEYFLFSQVEIAYPNFYIWIYIGVLLSMLAIAILSSLGVIEGVPKKFKLD